MIKVYNAKELIKYLIKIVFPLLLILIGTQLIAGELKNNSNIKISRDNKENQNALLSCIDDSIATIEKADDISQSNSEKYDLDSRIMVWEKAILASELTILNNKENNETSQTNGKVVASKELLTEEDNKEEPKSEEENQQNQEIKQAEENVKTEVIASGVNPRSTDDYNGVKINNSTSYQLTSQILNPDELNVNKNKVLIYHTHTCESYTPTEQNSYEESGNFRTTNLNYSVARVGDELTNQLTSYGCNVLHNKTYHDYPSYNGSYSRSLKTAESMLNDNKDTDIVIDLHRDAIADSTYAPKVKIGDEYVSQLMFVIGSDIANPINANWNQNLKYAIKIQQKANEMYPGLFKPIILRNSEYNQHVAKAACIIEVGATGNTLEESIAAMKYLAKVMESI